MGKITDFLLRYYYLFLFIFLFLGGIGIDNVWFYWSANVFSASILYIIFLSQGKLISPRNFGIYLLFLILFLLSLLWSLKPVISLNYFLLFLSGALFLLISFNFGQIVSKSVFKFSFVILILSTIFSVYTLMMEYMGIQKLGPFGLLGYSSNSFNHQHIGDLLAAGLIIPVYYLSKRSVNKLILILILLAGFYLLWLSKSRSAYVSLTAGTLFLFKNNLSRFFKKNNWLVTLVIIVLVGLFLWGGSQKSIIASRPFFAESLLGFYHRPFGVGVGNFDIISRDPANHLFGIKAFSSVAHNLVLEIVSGMGIFGFVFAFWLIISVVEVWKCRNLADGKQEKAERAISVAIFITLTVNFMFDFTYFIPAMLWIWFVSLGNTLSTSKRSLS